MQTKEDCVFCKIVSGDIPSKKIYEDDHVLAFLDLSQVTKGHTLIIPKAHEENIYELSSASAEHVFKAVPKVARAIKNAFLPEGINLLNNNGEVAGQSVFHFHVHLIPRYGKGDGFGAVWHDHSSQYSNDDLSKIAEKVRKKLIK